MTEIWGVIDVENLWIGAQKYALPSVAYKHRQKLEDNTLRESLMERMREYPAVLRRMIRVGVKQAYAVDQDPQLIAIGLFDLMRDDNPQYSPIKIGIKSAFESKCAHFSTIRPEGNLEDNWCDTFVVARAKRLLLTEAVKKDAILVIGTSDHYAAGVIQIALKELVEEKATPPRMMVVQFRHNQGKYFRQKSAFLKTLNPAVDLEHREEDLAVRVVPEGVRLVHLGHSGQ